MKKIILVLAIVTLSCKKENTKTNNLSEKTELVVSSFERHGLELLENNKFKNWDTNAKPSNWNINKNLNIPEDYVIDRDTLDLLLTRKEEVDVYIKQRVSVKPNTYYELSGDMGTQLRHGSYAGLSVSADDGKTLGKKIFDIRNDRDYKVIFNSNNYNEIICSVGFILEGTGDIMIKAISLKEVSLNETIYESRIAQLYFDTLNLDFKNEISFDESVRKIIKHTSDLMMSETRKDSLNIVRKDNLLKLIEDDSSLNKILNNPNERVTHSYPTKLVVTSIEALEEFNIGTKRIEFIQNKRRVHQSLGYYNPFAEKWIIIDPFFNSRISIDKNLSLIKKENVISTDFGGLSNNIKIFQRYKEVNETFIKEKIIGFPF